MPRAINRITVLAIVILCIAAAVRGSDYFALQHQPLLSFLCGFAAACGVMLLALLLFALVHPTLRTPRRR